MDIKDSVVLVTGANRGLGARLVTELVDRGARKVYAAARNVDSLAPIVEARDGVVVPLALDVTDASQVSAAAEQAADVNLLVNNAGTLALGAILGADLEFVERDLDVNYLGPLRTSRVFVPVIERNGGGAIVNVLTIIALAPVPGMAVYCAAKAAADSMTRALRMELSGRGVAVHGVYPAGIDTDMAASLEAPKADPAAVAAAILDGVQAGHEDITPDPISTEAWTLWRSDPRSLDRQFAGI